FAQHRSHRDAHPDTDQEPLEDGTASHSQHLGDNIGTGGAERNTYPEIAGPLVDGEGDGTVYPCGGEYGSDQSENHNERDHVPHLLGHLIDPALQITRHYDQVGIDFPDRRAHGGSTRQSGRGESHRKKGASGMRDTGPPDWWVIAAPY